MSLRISVPRARLAPVPTAPERFSEPSFVASVERCANVPVAVTNGDRRLAHTPTGERCPMPGENF